MTRLPPAPTDQYATGSSASLAGTPWAARSANSSNRALVPTA
ncbi:hypothetical protein [Streptomyces sp. NPDC004728]